MRKFNVLAAAAGIIMVMPFAALANNSQKDSGNNNGILKNRGIMGMNLRANNNDNDGRKGNNHQKITGTVISVNLATGFTMNGTNGQTLTVLTTGAKITEAFGGAISLSNVSVNDNVQVLGTQTGSQVNATFVLVTPANTHKAVGTGAVTAISGNILTVQQSNHGIVSTFTANTNASTTVTQNGTTTTTAAIQVGSKVSIKGLWNEVLNVLNAIKIRIGA